MQEVMLELRGEAEVCVKRRNTSRKSMCMSMCSGEDIGAWCCDLSATS